MAKTKTTKRKHPVKRKTVSKMPRGSSLTGGTGDINPQLIQTIVHRNWTTKAFNLDAGYTGQIVYDWEGRFVDTERQSTLWLEELVLFTPTTSQIGGTHITIPEILNIDLIFDPGSFTVNQGNVTHRYDKVSFGVLIATKQLSPTTELPGFIYQSNKNSIFLFDIDVNSHVHSNYVFGQPQNSGLAGPGIERHTLKRQYDFRDGAGHGRLFWGSQMFTYLFMFQDTTLTNLSANAVTVTGGVVDCSLNINYRYKKVPLNQYITQQTAIQSF